MYSHTSILPYSHTATVSFQINLERNCCRLSLRPLFERTQKKRGQPGVNKLLSRKIDEKELGCTFAVL